MVCNGDDNTEDYSYTVGRKDCMMAVDNRGGRWAGNLDNRAALWDCKLVCTWECKGWRSADSLFGVRR